MSDSNDSLDRSGNLLAMTNAIAALILTHPNPRVLRQYLEHFNDRQAKVFEQGDPEQELVEAYKFYSANFMAAVPSKPVPINIDADLELKFK